MTDEKTYKFTTPSGNDVILKTVANNEDYFAIYITCDAVGLSEEWAHLEDCTIRVFSKKLDKMCAVIIPDNISASILADKKEACKTDRIIVATVFNAKGHEVMQRFGKAVAMPERYGHHHYRLPNTMEAAIRTHSEDGKIYDAGGVEDECAAVESMIAWRGDLTRYYFSHFEPANPFVALFDKDADPSEEGEHELYTVELKLVKVFEED